MFPLCYVPAKVHLTHGVRRYDPNRFLSQVNQPNHEDQHPIINSTSLTVFIRIESGITRLFTTDVELNHLFVLLFLVHLDFRKSEYMQSLEFSLNYVI